MVGDTDKGNMVAIEEHSLDGDHERGTYEREVIELTREKSMTRTVHTQTHIEEYKENEDATISSLIKVGVWKRMARSAIGGKTESSIPIKRKIKEVSI